MAALLGSGLLVLGACAGDDGAKGDPGETGQPGLKGDPGEPGEAGNNGASCTVVDNTDGSRTVSCSDGTSATISNGAPGAKGDAGDAGTSCTATDNPDGSKTIACTDGTSVTILDGAPGAASFNLAAEMPKQLAIEISSITIASPPVVEFVVKDAAGRGAVGLNTNALRFMLNKLVAGTAGNPNHWVSYIYSSSGNPTSERNGTLVDRGDGRYTYTFNTDVATATLPGDGGLVGYDATATHRLSIQMSGSIAGASLPAVNHTYDFRPAGGALTLARDVVSKNSCNECHRELRAHGSRVETKYCVACHNPGMVDEDANFGRMIHGIHSAHMREAEGAPAFVLGPPTDEHSYAEVTYPQSLNNCLKCHNGEDADTPQGNNWRENPTRETCTGCHANWVANPHPSGLMANQTDNSRCANCHDESSIAKVHATEDPTPNTPGVLTGAHTIAYDLKGVTVNGDNQAVVTFRILKNGTPMNLAAGSADLADLTGSPSFLLAWASAQDGIAEPADYNNLGSNNAQPNSVSISSIQASLGTPDASGYYTVALTSRPFPAGATLRAVALQGYYTQQFVIADPNLPTGMRTETLARHAISVEKAVDGDDPRRMVVDSAKCANCHEWFLGHGGNRVYATDVCVMCHVPNLSSSGRGLAIDLDTNGSDPPNPPNGAARLTGEPASWGVQAGAPNPEDPLTYPEEGQSFKTLIHSIHGSAKRENAFEFVRNRCSNTNSTNCAYYYDFSHVTFPGILNDCSTCHVDATRSTEAGYSVLLPESALPTTVRTTTGADASPADVATARSGANLPNDTDLVTTPVAAACNGCHDSAIAASHMEGHGALIATARSVVVDEIATGEIETCALCHGPGRTVDVELMHAF